MVEYNIRGDLINPNSHQSIFDNLISVISPDINAFFMKDPGFREALFDSDLKQSQYERGNIMLCRSQINKIYEAYTLGVPIDGPSGDTILIRMNALKMAFIKASGISSSEFKMLVQEMRQGVVHSDERDSETHGEATANYSQTQDDVSSEEEQDLATNEEEPTFTPSDDISSADILGVDQDWTDYSQEEDPVAEEQNESVSQNAQSEEQDLVTDNDVSLEQQNQDVIEEPELQTEFEYRAQNETLNQTEEIAHRPIQKEIGEQHVDTSKKEEKLAVKREAVKREPVKPASKETLTASPKDINFDAPVKINVNIFGDYGEDEQDKEESDPFTEAMYSEPEPPKKKQPTLTAAVSFRKNEVFQEYTSGDDGDEYEQDVVLGLPSDGINLEDLDLKKESVASAKLIEYIINQDKKMNILTARITKIEEQMPHTGMLDIGSMYKVFDQRIELYRFNKHFLTIPNRFHNFGYRTEVTSMKFFVEHEGENWVVGMSNTMPSANENIPVYSYQNDPPRFEKILQKLLAKL